MTPESHHYYVLFDRLLVYILHAKTQEHVFLIISEDAMNAYAPVVTKEIIVNIEVG